MSAETLRAVGGFCPPSYSFALPALRITLREAFSAWELHWRDPAEVWARERELEMRRERRAAERMWNWP